MSVATSSVIERGLGSIVEDGAEVTIKCGAEVAIKSVKYGARNILYLVRVRRPDYLLPGAGSTCGLRAGSYWQGVPAPSHGGAARQRRNGQLMGDKPG